MNYLMFEYRDYVSNVSQGIDRDMLLEHLPISYVALEEDSWCHPHDLEYLLSDSLEDKEVNGVYFISHAYQANHSTLVSW